jgi:hypothetical protein
MPEIMKPYRRNRVLAEVPAAAGRRLDEHLGEGLTGIWLSRYEYVSSSRGGQRFAGEHYVLLIGPGV